MGKVLAFSEAIVILKEIWDSASDFFTEVIPNDFFKIMDKITFLTSEFLGLSSSGKFLDKTSNISESIMNLSNLVIWGILLFYGFKSIFSYFISKKVDMPWKFFIRMIVFGVLANASFFICYTGVFFTENCTEYIRNYMGESRVSFTYLEDYIEPDFSEDEEQEVNIYTIEALMSLFIYFSTFFTVICLGGRYILLKMLILISPIFFILGGFRGSEKIFFRWCKCFIGLLFIQIVCSVILGVFSAFDPGNELLFQIMICSTLFILCRNIFGFLNLCR